MKRIIAFMLLITMLFSVSVFPNTVSAQGNTVNLTDNFNDWEIIAGSGFESEKGILIYNNEKPKNSEDIILYTKNDFSNGEYSADVVMKKGKGITLLLCADEDKTAYSFKLDYSQKKILVYKKQNGGKEQLLKSEMYGFVYDKQHKITVAVDDTSMKLYVDGTFMTEIGDRTIKFGKIGFALSNAVASIPSVFCNSTVIAKDEENYQNDTEAVKIYVSPNGNDQNSGDEQNPIATLQKAKELARELSKNKTPVDVIFNEGEYILTSGVTFTKEDSGKKGAWITYKAAEGARVVFSGSKKLDTSKFEYVADEELLSRMCDNAKGKVMQLNLAQQGVPEELLHWTKRADEYDAKQPIGTIVKPQLFLNDRLQHISRWPNSGQTPIYGVVNKGESFSYGTPENVTKGGTISYKEARPERWTNAKDAFLHGHFNNPWFWEEAKIKSIDTHNMTMTMDHWVSYPYTTDYLLCGWQVINLLEEIDIPGEWYIDQNTSMLYYYPPHELTEEDTFEIGVLQDDMITLENAKYIKFEGLEFAKNSDIYGGRAYTRLDYIGGNGIRLKDAENILIKECTFRDLVSCCIHVEGKNVLIDSCRMYNYGRDAVKVFGSGDYQTITSGNTVIRNCHISGESMRYTGSNASGGINISGDGDIVGVTVENNIIHNMPMPAVNYGGMQNLIQYNELYNVQNNASDGGAIYAGRSWGQMGTVSQYNYIHDVGIQQPIHIATGVYWDDQMAGQIAKYNIIKTDNMQDGHGFWLNGGSHNTVESNTIINSKYGIRAHSTTMNAGSTQLEALLSKPFKSKVYVQNYPQMLELYTDKMTKGYVTIKNEFAGNLMMNAPNWIHEQRYVDDETINGNVIMEEYDESIFVDPENQDWRVTKEAKEKYGLSAGILDEDFDINLIGIQTDYKIKDEEMEFSLLYPENGQKGTEPENTEIVWEQSLFSDRYEYVVAEDKELTKIVAEGSTKNYSVILSELESNKTYYWTVTSVNDSRTLGCSHKTESGVYSFTTGDVSKLDNALLKVKIRQARETLDTITEGDKPGTYKPGTISEFKSIIDEAEKVLDIEYGSSTVIDEAITAIDNGKSSLSSKLNVGFTAPTISPQTGWYAIKEDVEVVTDEKEFSIRTTGGALNAVLTERLASSNIQCFDFMVEREADTGWYGIGIRQQAKEKYLWSDSYYIVVKPDVIEFQGSGKIFATAENNGKIKDNKWYSLKMAAINTASGVYYAVYIDDELLFEYLDSDGAVYDDGMITMYIPSSTKIKFRNSEKVEDGLFNLEERLEALKGSQKEE